MTSSRRFWICLIGIIAALLIIALRIWAATQVLTPSGNGPAVADGGTGRWTTYGSGSSAWGRLDNNGFAEGVTETTVNDSCNFEFDDYTLPAGATVSSVSAQVYACLRSGTAASIRVDRCDGSSCTNGSSEVLTSPEVSDCDQSYFYDWTTAPDGSSWDQTDVNNLRIRLILASASGSGNAGVSEIDLTVTYTVPSGGARRTKMLKIVNN